MIEKCSSCPLYLLPSDFNLSNGCFKKQQNQKKYINLAVSQPLFKHRVFPSLATIIMVLAISKFALANTGPVSVNNHQPSDLLILNSLVNNCKSPVEQLSLLNSTKFIRF